MRMAQTSTEGKLNEWVDAARGLFRFVQEAAAHGQPVHEVEKEIWERMLQMGREALGQFLACAGDGDVGDQVTMPDGRSWERLAEPHVRWYQSIFGAFRLERAVYGTREAQRIEYVPLDARLELPENEFSYVLQDWAQALGVEHAFAKTAGTLQRILRRSIPVDSLERMNRQMAQAVGEFRGSRPAPAKKDEGMIVVVTADGKGVPMRRPAHQVPAGARRKKGEKANKKQMATVGCVYTVDPKERTAEEVVAALFREPRPQDAWAEPQPVAQQKRVWSSLSHSGGDPQIDGEEVVFRWMFQEVKARREPWQPLVCVMDGQPSLWGSRRTHLPAEEVIEILDLLHVTPRLWEAAYLFHPEGSAQAATFVRSRLLEILRGRTGYVLGGLRQKGTKQGLRGPKLRKLRTICDYLQKNLTRMRYDEYLAEGYPIASGVIEGACRYVVKDRMERAGMRWTVAGAQAMLDLRTTFVNGQWEEFQSYRIERESQRLYPHGTLKHQAPCRVAA